MTKHRIPTNRVNPKHNPLAGIDADKQAGLMGKSENDYNKVGNTRPTQKNEGRRSPESRHDREAQVGSHNQHRERTSGPSGASR